MADRQVFRNNPVTTLGADVASGATSLTVSAGDGYLFPSLSVAGEFCKVTLVNSAGNVEIVKVTARTNDVLTIARAQEGTSARAWVTGDAVELRLTRGSLERFGQLNAAESVSAAWSFGLPLTVANATGSQHAITKGQSDAAYASAGHTHTLADATNVDLTGATEGMELRLRSSVWKPEHPGSVIANTSWLTAGTTSWSVPAGARKALVEVVGAGGGKGADNSGQGPSGAYTIIGGDGGDGGYARGIVSLVGVSTVSVVVGAGGVESADGGVSAFGALMSATGGAQGTDAGAPSDPVPTGANGTGTNGVLATEETNPYSARGNGGYEGSAAGQDGMVIVTILE